MAPVTVKGATARWLYLPRGRWHDFWTGDVVAGGRELDRPVDLATIPLYVRAGAVIPTGPVRQYSDEPVPGNTLLTVYPGADGMSVSHPFAVEGMRQAQYISTPAPGAPPRQEPA